VAAAVDDADRLVVDQDLDAIPREPKRVMPVERKVRAIRVVIDLVNR
jgi:hypothetical protein